MMLRQQESIDSLLSQIGLSAAEATIYLTLVSMGPTPAALIAKRTGTPRTTVYSLLNNLTARGFVTIELGSEPSRFIPSPPSTIPRLVRAESAEVIRRSKERETAADAIEKAIQPLFNREEYPIPRIQLFEGKNKIEAMLYDYESEWQRQIAQHDCTWWGYQDVDFVLHYRDWLEHYWSRMLPEERINLLSNRSEIERKLRKSVERRVIKQLPRGTEFSSTIWVLGEFVVMIMTRQQPNYAVLLRDRVCSENQRKIFQLLWQLVA